MGILAEQNVAVKLQKRNLQLYRTYIHLLNTFVTSVIILECMQ